MIVVLCEHGETKPHSFEVALGAGYWPVDCPGGRVFDLEEMADLLRSKGYIVAKQGGEYDYH